MTPRNLICDELLVIEIETNEYDNELTSLIVINCLLSMLTVVLNSTCLLAIFRLKKLEDGTRLILMNLCIADVLTGVVSQPLYAVFLFLQKLGGDYCSVASASLSVNLGLAYASFSMLLFASIERYLSLFYPFKYQEFIVGTKPRRIIAVIWLNSVLVPCLYSVKKAKMVLMMSGVILTCLACVLMSFIYIKVLCFAFKIRRRIKHETQGYHPAKDIRHTSKNITGFLVVLSVVFCAPHLINTCNKLFFVRQSNGILGYWFWTLFLANSIANPLCYCMKNREIRKGVLKLISIRTLFERSRHVNVRPIRALATDI